jgi:hypothetical protein
MAVHKYLRSNIRWFLFIATTHLTGIPPENLTLSATYLKMQYGCRHRSVLVFRFGYTLLPLLNQNIYLHPSCSFLGLKHHKCLLPSWKKGKNCTPQKNCSNHVQLLLSIIICLILKYVAMLNASYWTVLLPGGNPAGCILPMCMTNLASTSGSKLDDGPICHLLKFFLKLSTKSSF